MRDSDFYPNGGKGSIRLSFPITSSREITMPYDGIAIVRVMSAGGAGAKRSSFAATGGYSGAWGMKIIKVSKGQKLTFVVGAGGAPSSTDGDGAAGGLSSVTIAGVTYALAGGSGGINAASGVVPVVPDAPTIPAGWDYGAKSVKPGAIANGKTGGAGVDILAQGNNATTSASSAGSGGGGTVTPSTGATGGGFSPNGGDVNGYLPTAQGSYVDASNGEWGISFLGGGSYTAGTTSSVAGNGGGGSGVASAGSVNGKGGNGGGGAGYISGGVTTGGNGGLGGGGGGGNNVGGTGGDGYAHVELFVSAGV